MQLQVTQISTLEQYVQLNTLLTHLSVIKAIRIHQIEPSAITLTVNLKGDQETLNNALKESKQLFLFESANQSDPLTYAWQTPLTSS